MFLKFFGKDRDPATLSQRDWDRFIRDRRSGGVGPSGKPVSDRTIERDLRFLLAVLNWAAKPGLIFVSADGPTAWPCLLRNVYHLVCRNIVSHLTRWTYGGLRSAGIADVRMRICGRAGLPVAPDSERRTSGMGRDRMSPTLVFTRARHPSRRVAKFLRPYTHACRCSPT